jgi:hypothetical protein
VQDKSTYIQQAADARCVRLAKEVAQVVIAVQAHDAIIGVALRREAELEAREFEDIDPAQQ